MIFTAKESLEDRIVQHLTDKECSAKDLLDIIESGTARYTIQALYAALRSLTSCEVIAKRGKYYFLNEEWRSKVISKLEQKELSALSEGESISYALTSLIHHDLQWKNVVLPLHRAHPRDPIFFYSYHYIWMYLSESRTKSEIEYFASLQARKSHAFSLTGGSSPHDLEIKKKLQSEYVQWAVGVEYFSKTDYVTVFNDYIITTRLTKQLADEIEDCYRSSPDSLMLEEKLRKIGIEKKRVRLIVERNGHKAKKLRKKLSREFFVAKDLAEVFKLY